jgi:exodeoxyribonuclease-3
LEKQAPDVFCLQEIKAEASQLPSEVEHPKGYVSFFNSSREKKGYSGVALYSKTEPKEVNCDVLPARFNTEGRLIEAVFEDFILLNVYFPNGGGAPARLKYKLDFYDAFLDYVKKLKKHGKRVIFCGDVNVAHEEIDIARPKENEDHVGFLPEERAWADEVVAEGFVDTFRYLHPNKKDAYTYWDQKSKARDRNVGWRIDYFFVTGDLLGAVTKSEILPNVYGSDHCPIELVFSD